MMQISEKGGRGLTRGWAIAKQIKRWTAKRDRREAKHALRCDHEDPIPSKSSRLGRY